LAPPAPPSPPPSPQPPGGLSPSPPPPQPPIDNDDGRVLPISIGLAAMLVGVSLTLLFALLAAMFAAIDTRKDKVAGSDDTCALLKLPLISFCGILFAAFDFWTDVILAIDLLSSGATTANIIGIAMVALLVVSGTAAAYVVIIEIVIPINTGVRHSWMPRRGGGGEAEDRSIDWVDWERWDGRRGLNAMVIMLSFTNLEMLALLPWKKEALERKRSHKGYKGLPERWMLGRVIFVNLFLEAFPQLSLQIAYLTSTNSTNQLAWLTLVFSCISILFFVIYGLLHFDVDEVDLISRTMTLVPGRRTSLRRHSQDRRSTQQIAPGAAQGAAQGVLGGGGVRSSEGVDLERRSVSPVADAKTAKATKDKYGPKSTATATSPPLPDNSAYV